MSYLVTSTGITLRQQLRTEMLDLNRAIAASLGLDPRYTLSSNIALAVAKRTGVSFAHAKRWFHGGVAGFVSAMLAVFGLSTLATLGAGALLLVWLESFDSSGKLR